VTIAAPPVAPIHFRVSWSGQDGESGLRGYDVQYKVGITGTWTSWLTNTSQTQAPFVGEAGESYFFQVRATDHVNNESVWVEAGPVAVSAVTKYYYHGSQRVAMRQGDVVYFIHSDHLGSTSLTTDITGTLVAETRYLPYGEERWITGTLVTDFTFTGQRAERGFGLLDYNARYYDPRLGRFISPDSIVHNPSNPKALDRYSYGRNNPLKYIDPTGHQFLAVGLGEVVLLAGLALLAYEAGCQYGWGPNAAENRQALATAVNDVAEQVGTAFTPPSVPSSNPDAFPLGSPPDPYYVPGPALDTPEWSGLPGVPLDQQDTGTRAIDLPLLDQPGIGDNLLLYGGGRYKDLPGGPGIEKHHMPANSVSPFSKAEGPAIEMDAPDHRKTASWGREAYARKYRALQKRLIDQGRFDDAVLMDIEDIQAKFGDKYDEAILEMIDNLP
jgi:RHS repeat-associated protein